eukprot:13638113-Heterocapsa_arctica.AAC.1
MKIADLIRDGVQLFRTAGGSFTIPTGGVDTTLISAVVFNNNIGNFGANTLAITDFLGDPDSNNSTRAERAKDIKSFMTSMVTVPAHDAGDATMRKFDMDTAIVAGCVSCQDTAEDVFGYAVQTGGKA